MRVGVYSDYNGMPFALLASGRLVPASAERTINEVEFTPTLSLTEDLYWLAVTFADKAEIYGNWVSSRRTVVANNSIVPGVLPEIFGFVNQTGEYLHFAAGIYAEYVVNQVLSAGSKDPNIVPKNVSDPPRPSKSENQFDTQADFHDWPSSYSIPSDSDVDLSQMLPTEETIDVAALRELLSVPRPKH